MASLRVSYKPDSGENGELSGIVEAAGFAGSGSAWIGRKGVREFCDNLGARPLTAPFPGLAGGIWGDHGQLELTCLGIFIAPEGSGEALKVEVVLSQPSPAHDPADRLDHVRTWFLVGYEELGRFQAQLRRVLAGQADEAVLTSTLL